MARKKTRCCTLCREPGHYKNRCPNLLTFTDDALPKRLVKPKPITAISGDEALNRFEALLATAREKKAARDRADVELNDALAPIRALVEKLDA